MPGSTTSTNFFYTYLLRSVRTPFRYVGSTEVLRKRLREHNQGQTFSTRPYRPFELIYFEGCKSYTDAKRREHYLKTTGGRRFLAKRLKHYYFEQ